MKLNWSKPDDYIPELTANENDGCLESEMFLLKLINGNYLNAYLSGESSQDMFWWEPEGETIVEPEEIELLIPISEL